MTRLRGKIKTINSLLSKRRPLLGGNYYEYIFVGALFFVLTLFLTNFTILQGTHKLFIDGPGDGTAGFLWFNTVDTDPNPVLGHTDMANYPTGENLYNPTQITYTIVWGPLWLMSRVFGPVMGLNLITFLGLFSCALAMYWLVKKLTANPFVATFAAYATAYTPYHLIKSSSHLTYIFSVVFVLMIAAFIGYWRVPNIKRALLFSFTVAMAFYTDGYFLLIGSMLLITLLVGGVLYDLYNKNFKLLFKKRLQHLMVIVAALCVFMVPIGITQISQGSKVDNFLSSARGNIAFDINYYSTKPVDFLIPSPLNPFLKDDPTFQRVIAYQNQRSNGSENNTYIGVVIIVLTAVGVAFFAAYIFRSKKSHLIKYQFLENYKLVFAIGLVSIPVLVWCMLSPSLNIFGLSTVTLADLLLHFDISLWRVMARFYLPLHVMLVLLASLSLAMLVNYLWLKRSKAGERGTPWIMSVLLVATITVFVAVEYSTDVSRPSYNLNNIPKVYSWIRDQDDIQVVAEFPLLDRPLLVNYNFATAQLIHGKKLINTPLTNNVPGGRTGLGNIDSIEAINYAIVRGADTIITHNTDCIERTWGNLIYIEGNKVKTPEASYYGSPICVYSVKNTPTQTDPLFAQLQYGTFSDAPFVDDKGKHYSMIYMEDGWIKIVDAFGNKADTKKASFSANIQRTPGESLDDGRWSVYQDGQLIADGIIPGRIMIETIDTDKPIHIHLVSESGQITNPFKISLSDIVVTSK